VTVDITDTAVEAAAETLAIAQYGYNAWNSITSQSTRDRLRTKARAVLEAAVPLLASPDTDTAALRARLDAVQHLHREFRIYDECGHRHTEEGNGVISVENVGLTCPDGYRYSICRECCTCGSDYQTEECATNHQHACCWPCDTHRAASLRGGQ
jgi:hypothetical protein